MGVQVSDARTLSGVMMGQNGTRVAPETSSLRDTAGRFSRFCVPATLALTDAAMLPVAWLLTNGPSGIKMDAAETARFPLGAQLPPAVSLDGLLLIGLLLFLNANGHYRDRPPFWETCRQVLLASLGALLAMGSLDVVLLGERNVGALMLPWLVFPALVLVARGLAKQGLHRLGLWQIPVLMVGRPASCDEVMRVLATEGVSPFRPVGRMEVEEYLRLRPDQAGRELLRGYGAARLLLGIDLRAANSQDLVRRVTRIRLPFVLVPPTADLPMLGCRRSSFFSHDTVVLSYRSNLEEPLPRAIKTAMDLSIAGAMLLVLLPLYLVLFALIRIDGGPATFGHERVGLNGRRFRCLKFRSMVPNAGEVLAELLDRDPDAAAEWAATRKLTRDPRITRIGQVLRKTSLDELPQLINVLRREMSLVGPRPIVESEQAYYGEDLVYYHGARPGITGLWQVSGRSNTSYPRRVQLDSWYVRNWTMWHDIAILLKTIPAVLFRDGAR